MRTIKINMSQNSDDLLVLLPNAINKARFIMSLPTQKLFLFLVSKITYEERNVTGKFLNTLEFSLEEMYSLLRMSGRENDKNLKGLLKECVNEIGNNNIKYAEINDRGKEYWVNYPWSAKSVIDEDKGVFIFKFNSEIAWFLLKLKGYFKSKTEEYLKLNSSHAISLYMLLRSNEYGKTEQTYYIEELKEKLGVENNYQRWDHFKDRVLDTSMVQLNAETNYLFFYEAKRIGRSIGRIEFRTFNKEEDKEAISDFFTEKIQEFLKKEKVEKSAIENMTLVYYGYDAKENCINVSFKDDSSADTFRKSVAMRNKTNKEILKEVVYPTLKESKEFTKFLKTFFKEGVSINFVPKVIDKKVKLPPKPVEPPKKEDEIVIDQRDEKEKYITKIMLYGLSKNQAELISEREKEEEFDAVIAEMSLKIREGKLKISDSLGYLERVLKV